MLRLHRQHKYYDSGQLAHCARAVCGAIALLLLTVSAQGQVVPTQFAVGINAQPLLSHVIAADNSAFSGNFGHRNSRLHYSGGLSAQLTGERTFVETALRYDRQSALLYEKLTEGLDIRTMRVQYSGGSVPVLFGARLINNTASRYQLFLVGGGWFRMYQTSSVWYAWHSRRPWGWTASAQSDEPRGIWQQHRTVAPETPALHQEYGLEAGFRFRINVRNTGRIEYGLTYEWGMNPREGFEVQEVVFTQATHRLEPQVNAFRVNFAYYLFTLEHSGKWQRKRYVKPRQKGSKDTAG